MKIIPPEQMKTLTEYFYNSDTGIELGRSPIYLDSDRTRLGTLKFYLCSGFERGSRKMIPLLD